MPNFMIQFDEIIPLLSSRPTKRRGLQGKKFRKAKQAWNARRKQWVRGGKPTMSRRVIMPNAQVTITPDTLAFQATDRWDELTQAWGNLNYEFTLEAVSPRVFDAFIKGTDL